MTEPDTPFEALLTYLKESRGFDFTGYKRASLTRRVARRMAEVGISDHADYLDYLQVHPNEFVALFNTILINVTGFFRDPEAWDALATQVLPGILARRETDAPIRMWSAGCASGEEAYSLAITAAEAMGVERFRRRVKIYATDVDEDALTKARHAVYDERDLRGLPPELQSRYFEPSLGGYAFRKDLRRSVIFGRNDLVQDAPISRLDLIACRNTLMYFNAEAQARILSRFHFALNDGGVLFLGRAEMLLSHGDLFTPIDLKRRLFRKAAPGHAVERDVVAAAVDPPSDIPVGGLDRLRNEAFLASPVAQVVLTSDGLVALANREAERLFDVSAKDVGRPFQDLRLSYRPAELRHLVDQAQLERRTREVRGVSYQAGPGQVTYLDIQVTPLVAGDFGLVGMTLVFMDVTGAHRLRDELERANRRLETAYEELQSTNEELETTNEELQSTVEELETTNEELQSTNEELETMNEELQSTNDELQTINDELRERTAELDRANAFLEAVLTSLRAGVAVLNSDLRVRVWNSRAEDLWGVRRDEAVGEHFLNLDIGLPADRLRPMIRDVLSGAANLRELTLNAVNRRGRTIEVRVVATPLSRGEEPLGVLLAMETAGFETPAPAPPTDGRDRRDQAGLSRDAQP
ncbi:MAG TPA: CheR family methyltransferase [Micromonosporaceae bacterium]